MEFESLPPRIKSPRKSPNYTKVQDHSMKHSAEIKILDRLRQQAFSKLKMITGVYDRKCNRDSFL